MMMFNKWKSKGESNGGSAGVTETADGDHRGYRTHLIFAGKRDPEATSGQSGGSQSGSHFYGGHSSSHSLSHSNHPFAQAQQIRQPPHESAVARSRKGSRPPNLQVDEDFYARTAANKQVSKTPIALLTHKHIQLLKKCIHIQPAACTLLFVLHECKVCCNVIMLRENTN